MKQLLSLLVISLAHTLPGSSLFSTRNPQPPNGGDSWDTADKNEGPALAKYFSDSLAMKAKPVEHPSDISPNVGPEESGMVKYLSDNVADKVSDSIRRNNVALVDWHHHTHKQASAPAPAEAKPDAREAVSIAKQAAVVANKVAEHSIKITGHAKKALKHALGALHDARVDSSGLDKHQKHSLKKAEARLREATKTADYGRLKKIKDNKDLQKEQMEDDMQRSNSSGTEKEELREEIEELRRNLKEKKVDDKDTTKALDDMEAALDKGDGVSKDEMKAELERLREQSEKLESMEGSGSDDSDSESKLKKLPMSKNTGDTVSEGAAKFDQPGDDGAVTPVQEKGIDIDTQMPFGDLEPFGREDTAQELTESSVRESDEMVDQLERAEVAEEKRAVFRALTRLRGAAITSYDGVARSQTGNIDEYNKISKWRKAHPLHHLADEESDVTKWAFPDNAD